jgi:ATP-dependent DNA ligase
VAKRKPRWAVQAGPSSGELEPGTAAFAAQLRGEDTFAWPAEPTDRARFWGVTDHPYVVDVEFARLTPEGELVPVGVAVRRAFPTKRKKKGKNYSFVEGADLEPVSAVDLREIPFGRVIRAATAAVRRPEPTDERHDELERILVPPGRPKRGRSVKFYCELLKAAREFEQRSLSPAKEIARRKKVSENLVYQWLHVAREHARLGRCDG